MRRKRKFLDDRDTYIIAKALTIAIAVLGYERPYRQVNDIDDMKRLLELTNHRTASVLLFDRELAMVQGVGKNLERVSQKDWEERPAKLFRKVELFKAFPEDEGS